MDALQYAKELMKEITRETKSKCSLNEFNQIDVFITEEDKYSIEMMPIWKKFRLTNDKKILKDFTTKHLDFIKKVKSDLKNTLPEQNLEKLILRLDKKENTKETVVQQDVTDDLVLTVCIETKEYCKFVEITDLDKYGVEYIWEKAKENSLKKQYKDSSLDTKNEIFHIQMFDNDVDNITYQFIDENIIKEKYRNKFLAMPEEGQIILFNLVTEDRNKQMMGLNYFKEKIVNIYKKSSEPFSDKIYYYNKQNKLEEF